MSTKNVNEKKIKKQTNIIIDLAGRPTSPENASF